MVSFTTQWGVSNPWHNCLYLYRCPPHVITMPLSLLCLCLCTIQIMPVQWWSYPLIHSLMRSWEADKLCSNRWASASKYITKQHFWILNFTCLKWHLTYVSSINIETFVHRYSEFSLQANTNNFFLQTFFIKWKADQFLCKSWNTYRSNASEHSHISCKAGWFENRSVVLLEVNIHHKWLELFS